MISDRLRQKVFEKPSIISKVYEQLLSAVLHVVFDEIVEAKNPMALLGPSAKTRCKPRLERTRPIRAGLAIRVTRAVWTCCILTAAATRTAPADDPSGLHQNETLPLPPLPRLRCRIALDPNKWNELDSPWWKSLSADLRDHIQTELIQKLERVGPLQTF